MIRQSTCPACQTQIDTEIEAGDLVTCPACSRLVNLGPVPVHRSRRNGGSKANHWWIATGGLVLLVLLAPVAFYLAKTAAGALGLSAGETGATLLFVVVGCFAILLAVLWTLFPLFMWFDNRRTHQLLEQIRDRLPPVP